jgi:methylphosphotriester-DNA--protein-cysteine methyltransferase
MKYQKYRSSELLAPFVECYFTWDSEGNSITPFEVAFSSSGFSSIIFNSGDLYILHGSNNKQMMIPEQFLAGQVLHDFTIDFKGKIDLAGIVLKPTAIRSLFGLAAYFYTGKRIDLKHIFCKAWISYIAESLKVAEDSNEKVQLLEDFVMNHYIRQKPELDSLDYAANLILERNGLLDVKALPNEIGMSKETFDQQFFYRVGLLPEQYARLRRRSYIRSLISTKKKADWQSLLQLCINYDPVHFINDFTTLTGYSPQQYARMHRVPSVAQLIAQEAK